MSEVIPMDKNKPEEKKESKPKFTHRYFCDACTNIAGFVNIEEKLPKSITCQVCSKTKEFDDENLIKI